MARIAALALAFAVSFAAACGAGAIPPPSPAPTLALPTAPSLTATAPFGTKPAATSTEPGSADHRNAGWRADLELLLPAMERLHSNLFHGTPKGRLAGAVAALE